MAVMFTTDSNLPSFSLVPCGPQPCVITLHQLSLFTLSTPPVFPLSVNCLQFLINHHNCTPVSAVNWAIPNYCSCLARCTGVGETQIQWEYWEGQYLSLERRNSQGKQMPFHTSLITEQDDS